MYTFARSDSAFRGRFHISIKKSGRRGAHKDAHQRELHSRERRRQLRVTNVKRRARAIFGMLHSVKMKADLLIFLALGHR